LLTCMICWHVECPFVGLNYETLDSTEINISDFVIY
jgi:hypothetical protein